MSESSAAELQSLWNSARQTYQEQQGAGLKLDLTRGKPSSEQLDLSERLLSLPSGHTAADGTDVRNYGGLTGLPELRAMFAELLGVETEQLVAGNNSSLTIMSDVLSYLMRHGGVDSQQPWSAEQKVVFICPVPGYDRHFALLESLGIEMVTVPMNDDGPDVAAVKELVTDPAVKGMWLVPTYGNPTGITCSAEVAAELTAMQTAAPDFKILWDNAYALHHLTEEETKSADILGLASASGNPHRPVVFASTSKITFAGAGVAFLGGSVETIGWYTGHLGASSIGPDKVNHLRHAEFFGNADGVRAHMVKHREIIRPKFEAVERILADGLGRHGVATWTVPRGGYFVSLDVVPGTATRVVELAKEAGVSLTPAGSSFPYGKDPQDTNIRLAPTLPPLAEVESAMQVVVTCVLLAALEARGLSD
ncbi:aminotransferase class I/II-fold pyridoxal phosphate-dependent enzyme [Dermacoccaceae bacterium W4C1]